jgi:CMP-N-acetylneuraminic acid synthetase
MKIVYAVLARIGSSRVYKKPLQKFGNTTLIEWKVDQLKSIKNAKILVSSDSDEILDLVKGDRVEIHKRNKQYAQDHYSSFSDVIKHIAEIAVGRFGEDIHIAFTYPVTPLMSTQDYNKANEEYEQNVINGSFDSLVAVNLLKEYLWDDNGPINYKADSTHMQSQLLPNIYKVTNSLYMAPASVMLEKNYFLGEKPYLFQTDKLSAVDIDTMEDLELARALMPLYQSKKEINESKNNKF